MDLVREAVTKRHFPQLLFMSEHQFASFLKNRGFNVGIEGIRAFVKSGLIENLNAESGAFHPFHIWPISCLLHKLEIRLYGAVGYQGLDSARLRNVIDSSWSHRSKFVNDFPQSELCLEFNHRILPLLLWMESYFMPVIRGPRPGVIHLVNSDSYEWDEWSKESDPKELLKRHSVSIDQLWGYRIQILRDAFYNDPAPDLYLLFRSMPFDQRDRFRGCLRLAYDLYEIAEMIRLFMEQISRQPLVKEWDPTGHPDTMWVERLYGGQPKFGSPEFLRPLIRRHGLDPAFRVIWLVEGETEEGFILRYAKNLGWKLREFVTIRNFGGDGAFKKKIVAIDADLDAAKSEQCFVTLTFDNSDEARKRVDSLKSEKLVTLRFVLNEPDFELQNFSVDELTTVAVDWASELKQPLNLCQETLVIEVTRRIKEKQEDFEKAFNSVLHLNGESFKLSKGSTWGERLADHLIDKRNSEIENGVYSEQSLSKVEKQIFYILHSSQPFIDYPLSIKNLDPNKLEIV